MRVIGRLGPGRSLCAHRFLLQKKIIAELKKTMTRSPEDYDKFLADFGQLLKESL